MLWTRWILSGLRLTSLRMFDVGFSPAMGHQSCSWVGHVTKSIAIWLMGQQLGRAVVADWIQLHGQHDAVDSWG